MLEVLDSLSFHVVPAKYNCYLANINLSVCFECCAEYDKNLHYTWTKQIAAEFQDDDELTVAANVPGNFDDF